MEIHAEKSKRGAVQRLRGCSEILPSTRNLMWIMPP